MSKKRSRKEAEIRIIQEFLNLMGCKILQVTPNERPDAIVVIEEAGRRRKIGIELTEYHVDAPPGASSPGRKIHSFWCLVQSSIRRRVSHRPDIQHITGVVFLKKDKLPDNSKAKDLAGELVKLALDVKLSMDGEQTVNKFLTECPLSKDYVLKVTLIIRRGKDSARYVSWECANANVSSIGVTAEEITLIIQKKAKEFSKSQYSWGDVKERWLLISASGSTIFNVAGTRPENVKWALTALRLACSSVAVDRIFFWDRMLNWYKEVWPGAHAVQRE